jgi:hypothetical protein
LFTDTPAIRFSDLAISETHKDNDKTEIQAYRLKQVTRYDFRVPISGTFHFSNLTKAKSTLFYQTYNSGALGAISHGTSHNR